MRIQTKLNKWLKDHAFLTTAKLDEEDGFFYDTYNDVIHYQTDLSECLYIEDYIKFASSIANFDLHMFDAKTVSFLHELGHAETIYECSTVSYYVDFLRDILLLDDCDWLNKIRNFIYFRLPIEKAATEWAILYMMLNLDAVKELDMIMRGE